MYDAGTLQGIGTAIAVVAGIASAGAARAAQPDLAGAERTRLELGHLACLLMLGIVYWILRPAIWRAWLAHLYGVRTWDLRMVVWVCRILGMKDRPMISEAPADERE